MHLKIPRSLRASRPPAAFTLMELLVVISIILVLAAIAFPVYGVIMRGVNKGVATNNMRQVTAALMSYAAQNDGNFPQENIPAGSSWANAANPAMGEKVWYNALPRMAGSKGVGDYATTPANYYAKGNLLYLPGAQYPIAETRLLKPYFAFAINTKLQRVADKESKEKVAAKLSHITLPSRTVAFLEVGMPLEQSLQPKDITDLPSYDGGDPKASARSFVGRYGEQGVITFLDGHAETFAVKDLVNSNGQITWDENKVKAGELPRVIWCRTPEENPN